MDGGRRRATVRVRKVYVWGMDRGRAAAPDNLREGAAGVDVGLGGLRAVAAAHRGVVDQQHGLVAMATMRSMAPRSEVMQAITAQRTEYLFHEEILEESRRITSKANLWADFWARGGRWRQLCSRQQRVG